MSDLIATLTVLALFLIRFGIPFLVLVLVSFALHRLDAHWQKEAQVQNL